MILRNYSCVSFMLRIQCCVKGNTSKIWHRFSSTIGYEHHTVVCLSVCLSIYLSVALCTALERSGPSGSVYGVESCTVVLLGWHFLFTSSEFTFAAGMYRQATTLSEKPNRRNFRVWNSHELRGYVTIPDAADNRFCSYTVGYVVRRLHSTIGLLSDSYTSCKSADNNTI